MIRFMVCGTDAVFLDRLAKVLHSNFDPCTVEYLYGPSALEVSLKSDSGGADILLTDIDLRGNSSISIIAHSLKQSSPLQVIYMTSKIEYCTEVYETRHVGFLLKPINFHQLIKSVHRALRALEEQKSCGIIVQKSSSIHILAPHNLLYVESHGRVLKIVSEHETLETYDKIGNFSFRLDKRFLQCHKSYIVNMERVKKYNGESFQMIDGMFIPVSQSKRKEVREQFFKYMGIGVFSK